MSPRPTTTAQATSDWSSLRLVVFDVDGTLYDHRALRRRMAWDLAVHCLKRPGELRFVRWILEFRRTRERLAREEAAGIVQLQFAQPAARLGIEEERLRAVVETWIHRRPLQYLEACRFPDVERIIAELRRSGKTVAVLSDYRARDKVAAMGLEVDWVVSAEDECIDRLKPNPAGLKFLLERTGTEPSQCLMIGDRDDRDGECARRAGTAFLLRAPEVAGDPQRFSRYSGLLDRLGCASEGAVE